MNIYFFIIIIVIVGCTYSLIDKYIARRQRAKTDAESRMDLHYNHQQNQPPENAEPGPPPAPEPPECLSETDTLAAEGEAAVAEMRAIMRSVPSGAVKMKIAAISAVTEKIFLHLYEHPDDLRIVHRFHELYLPTTMKLLRAYENFSKSGSTGEHVTGTLERIEFALDSITMSYNKQYDALFKHQAIDIETDITALENMMRQQGL